MSNPRPLTFEYSSLTTTVTQFPDEPIRIEQASGPGHWQVIELMPEEVDAIMNRIEAGKKEGTITHVSDITTKTKFRVSDTGITLTSWATDNKESQPVGETMTVVMKRKDFNQIQGWMARYENEVQEAVKADPIQEAFEAEVLSILGYNK